MFNPSEFKYINNYNFGIISECPLCKAKVDLNIVEEMENGYLIHSKCKKCSNIVLIMAMINELGVNVIGMTTDLSVEEFMKFRKNDKAIDIDDVIGINKAFKKNKFVKELIQI